MRKKVISVVIATSVILGTTLPAVATPLENTLKQQQSQLKKNKESLAQVKKQRENLEVEIEKLDSNIESMMMQINSIKDKISKTEKDIKTAEKDLKKAEDDLNKQQKLYNERVRAMYINGADSYLEMILDSESFSDLISRVDTVKTIMNYDKNVMSKFNKKREEVSGRKKALDAEKEKLVKLKTENENKLAKLNEKKNEQHKLIAELDKQERTYSSKISQSQSVVNETMRRIEQMKNEAKNNKPSNNKPSNNKPSNNTPSRGDSNVSGNGVVAFASQYLGTRYVWGGTTPRPGFDCSGFVQYVYRHFGVNLPRTTYSQINVGRSVSRGNLQPGDLVFFGSSSSPHHVGMYVGNNCYIHAPRTGDVVKISPLTRSDYAGARRVK